MKHYYCCCWCCCCWYCWWLYLLRLVVAGVLTFSWVPCKVRWHYNGVDGSVLLHLCLEKVFSERQIHETHRTNNNIISGKHNIIAAVTIFSFALFRVNGTKQTLAWLLPLIHSNSFNSFVDPSDKGKGVQANGECLNPNQAHKKKEEEEGKVKRLNLT